MTKISNWITLSSVIALAALRGISLTPAMAQDVRVAVGPDLKWDENHLFTFPNIQNALDHAPQPGPSGRLYIEIAPGTYHERIYVSQLRPHVTLLGMGHDPSETVITSAQSPSTAQSTFFAETAEILGSDFQADNITFENTAGHVGPALAASVTADRVVFKHCRFLGNQDTLFANYGRQYYVDSFISGDVDFVFGNATAVFDKTEFHINRPGFITAQSRTSDSQTSGYVIWRSRITTGDLAGHTFKLGRPWRPYARVVVLDTELPANLDKEGWDDWGHNPEHVFYAEGGNHGPGANTTNRLNWIKSLDRAASRSYEPKQFLIGADNWDPEAEAAKLP